MTREGDQVTTILMLAEPYCGIVQVGLVLLGKFSPVFRFNNTRMEAVVSVVSGAGLWRHQVFSRMAVFAVKGTIPRPGRGFLLGGQEEGEDQEKQG